MTHSNRTVRIAAALLATVVFAGAAQAVHIQDLVRVKGQEGSKLIGTGIVAGLPGTGDGKSQSVPRQIARLLAQTSDPTATAAELKDLKNVAQVALTVNIPPSGVREGDRLDVHVSSVGGAKSLAGGRLFLAPMLGPIRGMGIYAYAEGEITVEDAVTPTVGVIAKGAQMVRDVRAGQVVKDGKLTLVLNNSVANWPMANELANQINGTMAPEGPDLATAVDAKNVVVEVPAYEQAKPGTFISTILTSYFPAAIINTGAVVSVNEKAGIIVIDGDVEISPVLVKVGDLTITSTPPPAPTGAEDEGQAPPPPQPEEQPFVRIDPGRRGGAKLADLMTALNQLKVDPSDCIAVIREIDKLGKLHARLIEE